MCLLNDVDKNSLRGEDKCFDLFYQPLTRVVHMSRKQRLLALVLPQCDMHAPASMMTGYIPQRSPSMGDNTCLRHEN